MHDNMCSVSIARWSISQLNMLATIFLFYFIYYVLFEGVGQITYS